MATSIKARISFPHLFEPSAAVQGGQEKYSVVCLIDKNDKETLAKIRQEVKDAEKRFLEKNGKLPYKEGLYKYPSVMHDGDGPKPDGEPFGAECAGMYVMRASSTNPPLVINRAKEPVTDPRDVYAGCYCLINFACGVFNSGGNKGITCYLNGVAKIEDGEPLSAGSPAATAKALAEELDAAYALDDDALFGGA